MNVRLLRQQRLRPERIETGVSAGHTDNRAQVRETTQNRLLPLDAYIEPSRNPPATARWTRGEWERNGRRGEWRVSHKMPLGSGDGQPHGAAQPVSILAELRG